MDLLSSVFTCTDSSGEDPGPSCHSCFDQSSSKNLFQFGWQVKVLEAPMDGDEQRRELQLPVLHHQVEQGVRFGVVGDPDVLQKYYFWLLGSPA